jgi:deazaflavin-dependent oxidoreductase (nitroreductase family)
MLDYSVIVPRLQRLYEWSAEELAEPLLLGLVRDGNPIYAWPFEERHVWRTPDMPFAGRVLERLTRPTTELAESDQSQYEPMATDYQRPGWFTKHVFNPIVAGLTRLGVSLVGSRVLEVRGRKSGEWRRTPVNPLKYDGERYIVAARGETHWVRNLRESGEGRLRKGRRIEEFTATELPDDEKLSLLRAYLKKWAWEVGAFFQGVGADAPDDDLRRIAPLHPVFRISRRHKRRLISPPSRDGLATAARHGGPQADQRPVVGDRVSLQEFRHASSHGLGALDLQEVAHALDREFLGLGQRGAEELGDLHPQRLGLRADHG